MANETELKIRDLVQDTLKQIGCQPEINDQDQIVFMFQGTRFFIDADNNSPFIQIFETWWATIGLTNPDAEKLKAAINLVNQNSFPTILYSIDEKNKALGVHCRLRAVFSPALPKLDEYLRVLLASFFQANQMVDNLMKQPMEGEAPATPGENAAPTAAPAN